MSPVLPAPLRRTVSDIRLTALRYAPFTERTRTRCPDGQLWFLLGGGWTTWIPGQPRRETPQLALSFHPPGEQNRQLVGVNGAKLFSIQVPPIMLRDPSAFLRIPTESMQHEQGPANRSVSRLLAAFLSGDQAAELLIEEELPTLLESLAARPKNHAVRRERGWVRTVTELLHDRYAEKLSLREIAALVGVHPVHLATAFRQTTGYAIGEYLRQIRLEATFRQLCATDRDLAEIAFAAGFYDQAHFSRLFKAHYHASPREFRRSLRGI